MEEEKAGCLSRAGCYRFMVSSAFRRWRVGSLDGRWPPSALWYLWLSDVEQPDRWPRRSGLCQLLPLWAHVWLADPRLWVTYCRDFAVLGSMVCEIVDSCRCCRTTTAPETAAGDGRDITPDDCSEVLRSLFSLINLVKSTRFIVSVGRSLNEYQFKSPGNVCPKQPFIAEPMVAHVAWVEDIPPKALL
uniref:Uncharacterized protein n=1 Tax=Glossina austeni TaxID=7395 RepID=A0A1A9V7S7_GLOAU